MAKNSKIYGARAVKLVRDFSNTLHNLFKDAREYGYTTEKLQTEKENRIYRDPIRKRLPEWAITHLWLEDSRLFDTMFKNLISTYIFEGVRKPSFSIKNCSEVDTVTGGYCWTYLLKDKDLVFLPIDEEVRKQDIEEGLLTESIVKKIGSYDPFRTKKFVIERRKKLITSCYVDELIEQEKLKARDA